MKKIILFFVIAFSITTVSAQWANTHCFKAESAPVNLGLQLSYGNGPSMDMQAGIFIKPIAVLGGVKYITDTTNKKITGDMNTKVYTGTLMARAMITDEFLFLPYLTVGQNKYFEAGIKGGYLFTNNLVLTGGISYAQKKTGFNFGVLIVL